MFSSTAVFAQSNSMLDQLKRLETQLQTLERSVYSNSPPPKNSMDKLFLEVSKAPPATVSQLQIKSSELEEQFRSLTGQVEELDHKIDIIRKRLDKLVVIEKRLNKVEQTISSKERPKKDNLNSPQNISKTKKPQNARKKIDTNLTINMNTNINKILKVTNWSIKKEKNPLGDVFIISYTLKNNYKKHIELIKGKLNFHDGLDDEITWITLAKNINVAPGEHQTFTRKHDFSWRIFGAGGGERLISIKKHLVKCVLDVDKMLFSDGSTVTFAKK